MSEQTNPKKPKKKKWFIIGAVVLVFIVIGAANSKGGASASSDSKPTATAPEPEKPKEPTLDDYKKDASELNYREALVGDVAKDSEVFAVGKITQKVEDDSFMVATKKDEFMGYLGNNVLLIFSEAPKIVEGDVIKVYGKFDGTEKYTTVLNSNAEVPKIVAKFVVVIKEKD